MLKHGITPKSYLEVVPYTAGEIEAIIHSLGLNLSEDDMKKLIWDVNHAKICWNASEYFVQKRFTTIAQSAEEEFKRMFELGNNAEVLIESLESYGYLLESALAPLENRIAEKEKIASRNEKLIGDLQLLVKDAESAKKYYGSHCSEQASKDKGGRPPKMFRHEFIQRLVKIYEETTKKKARKPSKDPYAGKYGGPFFRFVNACIQPIERTSNSALAQAIMNTIKKP